MQTISIQPREKVAEISEMKGTVTFQVLHASEPWTVQIFTITVCKTVDHIFMQ